MRLSHFFIERPVFATVLSLILMIAGAIAQQSLPISEYPEIVPPTVNIKATYPGASAEVIAETVAAPIEQEVNGVDDMLYISSQSTGDGQLNFIDNQLNGKSGTIRARAVVENEDFFLTPGTFGRLRLFGGNVDKLRIALYQGRAPSNRGRRRRLGLWRSRLFNEGLARPCKGCRTRLDGR